MIRKTKITIQKISYCNANQFYFTNNMSAHFFGCESVACGYHRDFYAQGKTLEMYMRPNRFRCSIMQHNRGTCVLLRLHM